MRVLLLPIKSNQIYLLLQDPTRHVMLAEVQLDLLLKYAAYGEGKSEDLAANG